MHIPIPVLIAVWLVAAVVVALLAGAMFNARAAMQIAQRINEHNLERYHAFEKYAYEEICNKAMLRHKDLPVPTAATYAYVSDVYDRAELMPYQFPIGTTPGESADLVYYWRRDKHELDAGELAHLWLYGVLS